MVDPLLFVLTVLFAIATTVAGFDPLFVWAVVAVTCEWCCITPLLTNATTVWSVLDTGRMTCACDNSV